MATDKKPEIMDAIQQKKRTEALKTRWKKEHYARVLVLIKLEDRPALLEAAKEEGVTVSRFFVESVNAAHPGLLTPLDDQSKKKKDSPQEEQPLKLTEPAKGPRKAGRPFGSKDTKKRIRRTQEEIQRDAEEESLNPPPKRPRGRPRKEKESSN